MKNWLIIFLVAAVVIAGAFLPEVLLSRSPLPELNLSQQELAISAQSSSDYTHRMDALGEYYFGEGLNLLSTYISQVTPEEGGTEAIEPFLTEFRKLASDGVIPDAVGQLLDENADYRIRYYYMFDSQSVSGFRYAELTAAASNWRIFLCMDMDSGKLVRVDYGGSLLFPNGQVSPQTSWYDVLRTFGTYLGLSDTPLTAGKAESLSEGARKYYDSNTADFRRVSVPLGGSAWVELRALKENYSAIITVYRGGK